MKKIFLFVFFAFSCRGEVYPKEIKKYFYIFPKSGVNLRKEASVKSQIVKNLPYRSIVELKKVTDSWEKIDNIESKWVQVDYKENIGYVFGAYLIESYPLTERELIGKFERITSSTPHRGFIKINADKTFSQFYLLCHSSLSASGTWELKTNHEEDFPYQYLYFKYLRSDKEVDLQFFKLRVLSRDKFSYLEYQGMDGCEFYKENEYYRVSD